MQKITVMDGKVEKIGKTPSTPAKKNKTGQYITDVSANFQFFSEFFRISNKIIGSKIERERYFD